MKVFFPYRGAHAAQGFNDPRGPHRQGGRARGGATMLESGVTVLVSSVPDGMGPIGLVQVLLGGKASTVAAARGPVREPVIIRGHRPGDSDPLNDLRRRARAQASRISRPAP